MLKVSDIREFIRLVDETNIHELHIETAELKVLIRKAETSRSAGGGAETAPVSVPAPVGPPVMAHEASIKAAEKPPEHVEDTASAVVKSPIFSIASAVGPINLTPTAWHTSAKSLFSDKKP